MKDVAREGIFYCCAALYWMYVCMYVLYRRQTQDEAGTLVKKIESQRKHGRKFECSKLHEIMKLG